jgi:quercetin dioxygenase-like cupin family protein
MSVLASSAAYADTSPPASEVKPSEIKWMPAPTLAPGGQVAVLYGTPSKPGPYALRVKLPPGFKILPHTHPDDRTVTIISGTLYRGKGNKFDEAAMEGFPPGSFLSVPAKAPHFNEARGEEVIFQVNGIGPTGSDYINPADDPRKK